MAKRIYLDYASLTPVDPRVLREMKRFSAPEFANPSSIYNEGVAAKKALEVARKSICEFIHAHSDEIVFTSGGTEANGLALEGAGRAALRALGKAGMKGPKPHLIISAIEHSSIMECAAMLEKNGVEVTRLPVDKNGVVSLGELKKAIRLQTFMVSIMTVNNEIGSVQPIREIAKVIRDAKKQRSKEGNIGPYYPLFHTDAAQAALYEDLNVEKLGVDLLTLDGSKVYGPRGIGALYVKRGTPVEPIIYGGGQERGLRSGTENLSGIAGFAKALEIARKSRAKEIIRVQALKEQFLRGLQGIRSDIIVNGNQSAVSSPHILSVSIPGIDNEFFVLQLDARDIACSTKSSCLRDAEESYVLKAIGADSRTSVRFSFGRWTKPRDVKKAILAISKILC